MLVGPDKTKPPVAPSAPNTTTDSSAKPTTPPESGTTQQPSNGAANGSTTTGGHHRLPIRPQTRQQSRPHHLRAERHSSPLMVLQMAARRREVRRCSQSRPVQRGSPRLYHRRKFKCSEKGRSKVWNPIIYADEPS